MANYRTSSWLIFILLSGLNIGPDGATSHTIKEAKLCYLRLPTHVKPLEYDIDLKFQNGFATIMGKADILIEFVQSSTANRFLANLCGPARNKIILHLGSDLRIDEARLSTAKSRDALKSGQGVEVKVKRIVRDNHTKMIALELERDLPPHSSFASLSIAYESEVPNPRLITPSDWPDTENMKSDTPSHYVAHLQGGQARNLFPCFDEPQLRARIRLRVQHSSDLSLSVVTNLARNEGHYESAEMMPVSGLVLGFRVDSARGSERLSTELDGGIQVSISGLPTNSDDRSRGSHALDFASRCVKWLETNLKVGFPIKRLELIGVPNSERWGQIAGLGLGLIRYEYLSVNENNEKSAEQNEAARIKHFELQAESAFHVALAVARQLFGYAIRPDGWSNLWITEGLALRAVLKMVDQLEPDLHLGHYVRSHYLARALQLDVNGQYPPISHPGDYPAKTSISPKAFDALRLVKAASIMQMLEKTLAPGVNFDQVVGSLLRSESKLSEGVSLQKLTTALSIGLRHPSRIADLIKPWVEISGFPTMDISLDENLSAISIRQRKSTRSASFGERIAQGPSQWPLQMKFVFYSKSNLQFNEMDLLHKFLEAKRSRGPGETQVSLKLPDWLQRVPARFELYDDYEVLPYYQVNCSPGPVSCPSTIAQASLALKQDATVDR